MGDDPAPLTLRTYSALINAPLAAVDAALRADMLAQRGGRTLVRVDSEDVGAERIELSYTALDLLGNPTYSGRVVMTTRGQRTRLDMDAPYPYRGAIAAWHQWVRDAIAPAARALGGADGGIGR